MKARAQEPGAPPLPGAEYDFARSARSLNKAAGAGVGGSSTVLYCRRAARAAESTSTTCVPLRTTASVAAPGAGAARARPPYSYCTVATVVEQGQRALKTVSLAERASEERMIIIVMNFLLVRRTHHALCSLLLNKKRAAFRRSSS